MDEIKKCEAVELPSAAKAETIRNAGKENYNEFEIPVQRN